MLAIRNGHVGNHFSDKFIHLCHTGYFINGVKRKLTVNVCMHDFDDAKEESNKVASKDKQCFKINTRLL